MMTRNKETVLLYHAYGNIALHQQVMFSILTLHHFIVGNYDNLTVVVYTDEPNLYQQFQTKIPISFELLTPEILSTFKGPNQFVHRVKICIIKDCFDKYKKNILYLDSDTYFTESPFSLFNNIDTNKSIMNSNDYDLNNADELYENLDWLLIRRAIRDYEYTIDGNIIKIPLTTRMWNAGVIGLSFENRGILEKVLDLTDQIYKNKKVFTAEQFAFSYYLQNHTNMMTSGNVIFHYWPNFIGKYWKSMYNYHFRHFFEDYKNLSLTEKAIKAVELTYKHEELILLPKKTKWQRFYRRIKLAGVILLKGKV